jgi:pimeloyl-ACP methyl ester carboxylesterase
LADWLGETRAIVEALTDGPLVLIGSSMGAWIALHLALAIPARVQALVGIAAAPDFTEWGFTPEQKEQLRKFGMLEGASEHGGQAPPITRAFWESGQSLLLLGGPIAIDCPVRLVHGEADGEVPPAVARRLMEQLRSADVQLTIVKGGGHRLSEPHQIKAIVRTVASLVEPMQ